MSCHLTTTETPDIVFAFADVMQMQLPNGEMKLIGANQMLQPELMYDQIV